jgi:hypothetical protein
VTHWEVFVDSDKKPFEIEADSFTRDPNDARVVNFYVKSATGVPGVRTLVASIYGATVVRMEVDE